MTPWTAAAGGAVGLALLLIAGHLWPAPGWPGESPGRVEQARSALLGLAAGLAGMGAIELTLVVLGAARLTPGTPPPTPGPAVGWALTALLVAGAQEGWVRGWLMARLSARWGFRGAAIVTSGVFVLLHAEPGALVLAPRLILLGAAGLFLFGLAAAASVRVTGSIAWAIGAHAGWDYVEGFILGAPSFGRSPGRGCLLIFEPNPAWSWAAGGAFGPEASPLAILALGAAAWGWLGVRRRHGASH